MRRVVLCVLLFLLVLGAAQAQAPAPGAADTIPPLLRDWRSWVLKNHEFLACPLLAGAAAGEAGSYVCAWPGRLSLDADTGGLRFTQQWRVDAPSWIPLPGDAENWPQDVQVNGQSAPVLEHEDGPQLRLAPGSYRIEGRIPWARRPQQLPVPEAVALIDLRVDGKSVQPLERNGEQLTLGRGEATEPEADEISIEVFRKLTDDIPARLETRLRLHVSGQAREETVGPVLPRGFVPLALQGGITARLGNDGRLHMQVQPGDWDLSFSARATEPLAKVVVPAIEEPWPAQEIWSFETLSWLRVGTARADSPIDPAQAGVPPDWRNLPAFALAAEGELAVEEQSRGISSADANRLHLQRDVWLQFDGVAMYAKDRVSGSMSRDWRLDVAAPYVLERAESGGEGLLVTQSGAGLTGVELRESAVNLGAGVRIGTRKGELPIAGWQQPFDSINWTLHLPYSYRLLAAPGADSAGGSWIARWTLLDVFLVAVTALLAARLLGWIGGVIVLGYLVLGYHEANAPLWTLLAVIALGLAVKALPAGKLRSVAFWITAVPALLLACWTLLFVAQQVRYTLYPQLEDAISWQAIPTGGIAGNVAMQQEAPVDSVVVTEEASPMSIPAPPPAPSAPAAPPQKAETGGELFGKSVSSLAGYAGKPRSREARLQNNAVQRYAQNTIIQAGRGEPSWNLGRTYQLSWSGPVLADQTVRLVISPPWLTRLLRLAMLGLLLATLAALVRRYRDTRPPTGAARVATAGAAGAALSAWVLGLALAVPAAPLQAQGVPDANLLEQLRQRLVEAPQCAPDCARAARVEIRASGDTLALAYEIHAGERVAVPLPVVDGSIALDSVRVGGVAAETVARHEEQDWLALGRGVHRIQLDYRVIDSDHAALKFALAPAEVRLDLNGWQAVGVSENRLLGDTVTLSREREAGSASPIRGGTQQFPPYVQVERSLAFDLEWRVLTTVRRLAPAEGGFSVRVPLLPGEQVLSSDAKVEAGQVLLSFGADESETSWNSTLTRGEAVELAAPALGDRAEVWSVVLSPTWHAQFDGLPEARAQAPSGQWVHEFHPLPGEKLRIALSRPEAVAGKSIAIDDVVVETEASKRALDTSLQISLRSTQGGEHAIQLPPGAEVLAVTKNGQSMNLRPREGKLSLPVTPGSNRFVVQLRQAQELGLRARTPEFDLGLPSANLQLRLNLPADRWVLFTQGPMAGPAVLYWGELIVMILLACALARTRRTPLKLWQWLLLGFGFSTASWVALLVVVAWLFLLDWRERWQTSSAALFNLAQIGIALFSVPVMFCLVGAVYAGLLGDPDMSVTGNGSYARALRWFADQAPALLPQAGALTLPLWLHKLAMLAWALWLASALVGWLRWAFAAWTRGGYWRNDPRVRVQKLPDPPPPAPAPPSEGSA